MQFAGSDRWISRGRFGAVSLPETKIDSYKLEGLNASTLPLIYNSFDMLGKFCVMQGQGGAEKLEGPSP